MWHFRLPDPGTAWFVAACADAKLSASDRAAAMLRFCEYVLTPTDFEYLCDVAYDHDADITTEVLLDLMEKILEFGSARPPWVDSSLAMVAYRQWPTVRGRLVTSGIADPLRQLPTLYALLDAVEALVLDSMEKQEDRDRYFTRTYAPPHGWAQRGDRVPKGFEPDSELEAFMSLSEEA